MSSEIVSIIFRILNFGVACGVGGYVFKKNILPGMQENIAAQRAQLQGMVQRNQDLLDQNDIVHREIIEQEELGKKLYDQIKIWSFSFQKEVEQRTQARQLLERSMEQRAHDQAEHKLKMSIQSRVLTSALVGAREELLVRFASEQEGKKFIASIVEHMRKDMR